MYVSHRLGHIFFTASADISIQNKANKSFGCREHNHYCLNFRTTFVLRSVPTILNSKFFTLMAVKSLVLGEEVNQLFTCHFGWGRLHERSNKAFDRGEKRRKSNLFRKLMKVLESVCKRTDTVWGCIYFLMCDIFGWKTWTWCAKALTFSPINLKSCLCQLRQTLLRVIF